MSAAVPRGSADIDPTLFSTLLAVVSAERETLVSVAKTTKSDEGIDQLSTDLLRTLSASDSLIKKLRDALAGTEAKRKAMGTYWAPLWKDLPSTADGCVFLDHRIILPEALRDAFLGFFHWSHAGAQAMKRKA